MVSLVTDRGLKALVDAIVASNSVKYIGWGGGSGQGLTATDLAAAFSESRTAGMPSVATTNTTDDTYRVTGGIAATVARAVTEVGVFSDAVGASLSVYGDFAAINLGVGDTISFTIDVVIDQV